MSDAPRILIFTGDGKGKTTAALGMALRACGHGQKVCVIQFVKNNSSVGEIKALPSLPGVEFAQTGKGFVPPRTDPAFAAHKAAAAKGLAIAREAITSGKFSLVILDEICVAVALKLVPEPDVVAAVCMAGPGMSVVLTGRNATPRLIEIADTVTEMRCVKHAFKDGRNARPGVEM